jgi:hypothetical protein
MMAMRMVGQKVFLMVRWKALKSVVYSVLCVAESMEIELAASLVNLKGDKLVVS